MAAIDSPTAAPPPRRCRLCDYDLSGHAGDTRCPECGALATLTPPPRPIDAADPLWIADLRTGLRLILIATAIAIGSGGLSLMLLMGARGKSYADVPLFIGLLVAGCVACRGWWVVTRPEPEAQHSAPRYVLGITLRSSAIAAIPCIGVVLLLRLLGTSLNDPLLYLNVFMAGLGLASAVHLVAAFRFFRRLALLCNELSAAKALALFSLVFPVGISLLIVQDLGWLRVPAPAGRPTTTHQVFDMAVAALTVGSAIVFLCGPLIYFLALTEAHSKLPPPPRTPGPTPP